MKKILIASRWYKPIKNPRAFRTYELISELKRRGYEITACLPEDAEVQNNVNHAIVPCGNMMKSVERTNSDISSSKTVFFNKIRNLFLFFLGDGPVALRYAFYMYKVVKQIIKNGNKFDVIISISYPFYINVAIALLKKVFNPSTIMIADCGDPFYNNTSFNKAFYLKNLEKWVLNRFDYVTIPIENAKKDYLNYLPQNNICVIPQGFKFTVIKEDLYKRNDIPTFGYAGIFYESIRNPRYFLEYLTTLNFGFKFVVYAREDGFTNGLLAEYKDKLGNKIDVHGAIDREKLIQEMAKWDFVINFDNNNSNQRPSKLIDYAMSKRPILSFNRATFIPAVFQDFLNGNYKEAEEIDLTQYDIRNVVNKFEVLFNNKKECGIK